uniref:4-alpha-glucanotransferase n=1 Tax=Alistipes shahii TaxID=328814 RepID=UPI003FEF6F7B
MTLLISIEYRTRWGEQLVLRLGKRRIALQYADGGVWTCAVERYAPAAQPAEYRYEVEREGVCIRSEWRPHTLRIPSREGVRTLRIRDRWQEMPSDTPFYSSAFTRGIFGRGKTGNPKKAAGNITLRVILPTLRPDETLAVAGSGRELGDWKRIVPMDDSRFPEWELTLHTAHRFEYKFLIADRKTLTPILWEEGANRTWGELPGAGEHALDAAAYPRFPERRWQGAGTAIPVFSLRTEEDFGVGEFYDLKRLIDWAAATGQCVIQVLPINDTTMTGTWEDSYPYNANSTFALHPQFIRLPAAGVVEDDEYRTLRNELNALPEIDYERVNRHKLRLLRRAFERHGTRTAARRDYKDFIAANRHWLIPYAAFCTLRDEFGTADFSRWGDYARYDKKAVEAYCRRNSREIAFHCFVQYHLHTQLSEVCAYARSRGVVLKGDLPIGVSRTSADAWIHPRLFHMDSQAGAPPDAFSASGQNWGFPTYDWEHMAQDGYAWWQARMAKMAEYFDAFRID